MKTISRNHLSLLLMLAVLLTAASMVHAETPEQRLAAAGYTLPEPPKPVATYVTARQVGNLLFLSGHGECGDDLDEAQDTHAPQPLSYNIFRLLP